MTTTERDNPGVIVFPPLLFVSCLVVGLALHLVWPLRTHLPLIWRIAPATLMFAAAAVLALGGERALHGAGTHVRPDRPTIAIVTSGVYGYTRNPLYLALLCLYTGITLCVDALWPFLMWTVLLPVLSIGIIQREERYLEAKFGQPYLAYKARVGRWL